MQKKPLRRRPKTAICDLLQLGVSAEGVAIYAYLLCFEKDCVVSDLPQKQMAFILRKNRKTIIKLLRELQDKNVLTIKHVGKTEFNYYIISKI